MFLKVPCEICINPWDHIYPTVTNYTPLFWTRIIRLLNLILASCKTVFSFYSEGRVFIRNVVFPMEISPPFRVTLDASSTTTSLVLFLSTWSLAHTISQGTTEQLTHSASFIHVFPLMGFLLMQKDSGVSPTPPQSAPINWACPLEPTQTINTQVTVPNSDMIVPLLCKQNPLAVIHLVISEIFMHSEKSLVLSLVFDPSARSKDTDCLLLFELQHCQTYLTYSIKVQSNSASQTWSIVYAGLRKSAADDSALGSPSVGF